MNASPFYLTIVNRGSPSFPRCLIKNQFGQTWTGKGWDENERKGELFTDPALAAEVLYNIQVLLSQHLPCVVKFVAPVEIEVRSDKPVSLDEIKKWAAVAGTLVMDTERAGTGPMDGSMGLIHIDWNKMQQTSQQEE